jgi:hypothetical protein
MARFGTATAGSFVGGIAGGIWTEVVDVLIPQMITYNNTASVRVPVNAGKWEGHIVSDNHPHLRIDLQGLTEPLTTNGVTWQTGSNALQGDASPIKYANWQVQYGSEGSTRAKFAANRFLNGSDLQKNKGSIAGVRMALANDFTIADIQRAFQLSYTGCVQSGNVFGVLLPAGVYTEPIVEVEQRWIFTIKCKRACKDTNKPAFKVSFGKKEGEFVDKIRVQTFLDNALSHVPCPKCASQYALEFDGTDFLIAQNVGGKSKWAYNFDRNSFTLVSV